MGTADIGMVGLGVMGAGLARNFESRGYTVAVYNRELEDMDAFLARYPGRFVRCATYPELAAALKPPRRVVMMVTAGRAVDAVLGALGEVLQAEDIVVDGGNSHYADTERRLATADERGIRFFGMGVSGGQAGALRGPAMMPGGDRQSFEALRPILESAAAVSDSGPCVAWCGTGSAGHFVKMVHNGIEYGDMQLIAEVNLLLREGLGLESAAVRDVFCRWNEGALASYLIEITSRIVGARDPQGDGPLVDRILDVAGQKGTGRWTSIIAVESGVPLPTVTAAVDARALSAMKAVRIEAQKAFEPTTRALAEVSVHDLEQALYAAKIMSYTQGFELLRVANEARDYQTDRAAVARIWKAGCIIRAAFLDRVYDAFAETPELPLLFLAPTFAAELPERVAALRRVVAAAVSSGYPIPALSASLAYFDTLTRASGTANIIQAQRDYFGAHTYRRVDDPDTPVHSHWPDLDPI